MNYSIMGYAHDLVQFTKTVLSEATVGEERETVTSSKPAVLLEFLLEDSDEPNRPHPYRYIKVVWDVDALVQQLLHTDRPTYTALISASNRATYQDGNRYYKLWLVPGKVLGIDFGRYSTYIYSLRQFFPADTVDEVSKDWPLTARRVAELGEKLLGQLAKMKLYPTKLSSPIGVYQETVLDHMQVPGISTVPQDSLASLHYATQCMDREWRANYQPKHSLVGSWLYDVVAAYPSIARLLPDTDNCEVIHSQHYVPGCHWAYLHGTITIDNPPDGISPILMWDNEEGRYIAPSKGQWLDTIMLREARHIKKWGYGSFSCEDGWYIKFHTKSRPFERAFDRLFEARERGPWFSKLSKAIGVGIVGKFAEEYENNYGQFYNPFYASAVLTQNRLDVADFIYSRKISRYTIGVNVDGVLTDKRIPGEYTSNPGSWREVPPVA